MTVHRTIVKACVAVCLIMVVITTVNGCGPSKKPCTRNSQCRSNQRCSKYSSSVSRTGGFYQKRTCQKSYHVNGNWGGWSAYTRCPVSCGGGHKRRTRRCDNPAPEWGGDACKGNSTQSPSTQIWQLTLTPCNTHACPAGTPTLGKCGPVEEYAPADVVCSVASLGRPNSVHNNITWHYLFNGLRSNSVFTCTFGDKSSCDNKPGMYSYRDEVIGSVEDGTFIATLTVKNMIRTRNVWTCCVDNICASPNCTFQVYLKPDTPTIDPPVKVNDTHLSVHARSTRVYPSGDCLFFYRDSRGHETASPPSEVKNTRIGTLGDVITQCWLVVDMGILSTPEGLPSFKASVFPVFEGSSFMDGQNSSYAISTGTGIVDGPANEWTNWSPCTLHSDVRA